MNEERTTPLSLWSFARDFLDAARLVGVSSRHEISAPHYYLLGHATELTLKAFLLANGIAVHDLKKKIGHDLEKAFDRAVEFNLSKHVTVTLEEEKSLRLLNTTYRPKEHEYVVTGFRELPRPALIVSLVEKVLDASQSMCFTAAVETLG